MPTGSFKFVLPNDARADREQSSLVACLRQSLGIETDSSSL